MINIKLGNWNKVEAITFISVIIAIIVNAILTHDAFPALISAICGITYVTLAGKGTPLCYIIGLIGTFFYSAMAFQHSLWGHLAIYVLYYIPMQFLGFILWNKNLQKNKDVIVKKKLTNKERLLYLAISIIAILLLICILYKLKDAHPVLDGITTIFSFLGMYFTVKRCIEQWISWMIVNTLSLLMWTFY